MIFDSVGEKYNGFRALRQIAIELGLEAYLEDEHRIRFVDPKTTEKRFMFVPDLSMYGYMDTRKRASICQELARIFHMEPLQPKSQKTSFYLPEIQRVIFNNPCTVVIWKDGSKTIVRCQNGEPFDEEKGLAMAFAKKALGNRGNYFDEFRKWLPKIEEKQRKEKPFIKYCCNCEFRDRYGNEQPCCFCVEKSKWKPRREDS